MAWKQAVGRWHWLQLTIACYVACTLAAAAVFGGLLLAEHRESQFDECRSAGEVTSSWIWTRAEAVGIQRTLPIGADAESRARHDSVASVADAETSRAWERCEASVGSPDLGAAAAVIGFLLGVTALLSMLWVWFGARRREDGP